jgi:hypothetical protein
MDAAAPRKRSELARFRTEDFITASDSESCDRVSQTTGPARGVDVGESLVRPSVTKL